MTRHSQRIHFVTLLILLDISQHLNVVSAFSTNSHPLTRITGAPRTSTSLRAVRFGPNLLEKSRRAIASLKRKKKTEPILSQNDSSSSPWSTLKDGFYFATDASTSLIQPTKSKQKDIIVEGYSEVEVAGTDASSPGQRLMRQYDASPTRRILTREEDDTTAYTSPPSSKLVAAKDAIYDLISPKPKASLPNIQRGTMESSISTAMSADLKYDTQIQRLLPLLRSRNPVTKFKVQWEIQSLERKNEKRKNRAAREKAFFEVKKTIYEVGDVTQKVFQVAVETPGKVYDTSVQVGKTLSEIPSLVESTYKETKDIAEVVIEDVKAIPQTVQSSFENAKRSVGETIQTIQSIPKTVEDTIDQTKQTVESTIQAVQDTAKTAEKVITKVKIITGLEEAPPPPPPPPPTKREIALSVAGTVGKGALSAAWYVGKGTFSLGAKGIKLAFLNMKDKAQKAAEEDLLRGTKISSRTVALSRKDKVGTKIQTLQKEGLNEGLEKEVSDALLLAKEALEKADEPAEANEVSDGLRLAKEGLEKADEPAAVLLADAREVRVKAEVTMQMAEENGVSIGMKEENIAQNMPIFFSSTIPGLEGLSVLQLKEKLREKGLKVSGKKQDLIERLEQDDQSKEEEKTLQL